MMTIPISLLPLYVITVVKLGQAAISQEVWAIQYIKKHQITVEQINRLEAIETQFSGPIAQLLQQLDQAQRELIELMVSIAPATQLRERERQFEALQIQAAQLYFEEFLEIREVLTIEQRQQLAWPGGNSNYRKT